MDPFFWKKSLSLLSENDKNGFIEFLNKYELNPYNMFICKNTKILYQFYDEIFPWLFKCENEFKNLNLEGYEKKRIYGFLAERFMPYWFKKNFKTTTCQITFFFLIIKNIFVIYGGENGIRTHDRVSPIHAFQACAFNHSATSPLLN